MLCPEAALSVDELGSARRAILMGFPFAIQRIQLPGANESAGANESGLGRGDLKKRPIRRESPSDFRSKRHWLFCQQRMLGGGAVATRSGLHFLLSASRIGRWQTLRVGMFAIGVP